MTVTLRPARQGGHFQGEERIRIRLLEEALAYDPDFVDVEWDTPSELIGSVLRKKREKTGVIISYHNFAETPQGLESLSRKLASRGADVVKIVTQANSLVDNVRMLRLVEKRARKTIAFCMGPFGIPSRILTLRAGGEMTFGALEAGKGSSPGEIHAKDLKELYRVHQINRKTRVFGLIGNPIAHSLSPHIHNLAFQAVGFDAVYVPFQVRDLRNLLHGHLESFGAQGISVTIPHKERVIPLLDGVAEEAKKLGAVNTLYRQNGHWHGTNTDAYGAWKALETAGVDLRQKRWTILGAGGAARAVAYGAGANGRPRSLMVLGRSMRRLERFLHDVREGVSSPVAGAVFANADLRRVLDETDILVNASPVGMFPNMDESLIPSNLLEARHVVFDMVYNPLETRLLREARERGSHTVSGLQMFLHQGAAQFELWVGKTAPLRLMERIARERLEW